MPPPYYVTITTLTCAGQNQKTPLERSVIAPHSREDYSLPGEACAREVSWRILDDFGAVQTFSAPFRRTKRLMSRCATARLIPLPSSASPSCWADRARSCTPEATFNMDLLEKNDHLPAVDLQRFNQQAGQPPGAYPVSWQVNGVTLDARKTVTFRQNDRGQLTPCLKPEDLLQAGVNPAVLSQAPGATSRSCPELNALLPGSTVNFDFAHQRLVMTIPQALMTHRARDNVPSALWDEGISAFQSNYRYSGASQRTREGSTERDNYLMLKSGVNVGASAPARQQ